MSLSLGDTVQTENCQLLNQVTGIKFSFQNLKIWLTQTICLYILFFIPLPPKYYWDEGWGGWSLILDLTLNRYDWKDLKIEGDGKGTISRGSIAYLRMNYLLPSFLVHSTI